MTIYLEIVDEPRDVGRRPRRGAGAVRLQSFSDLVRVLVECNHRIPVLRLCNWINYRSLIKQ